MGDDEGTIRAEFVPDEGFPRRLALAAWRYELTRPASGAVLVLLLLAGLLMTLVGAALLVGGSSDGIGGLAAGVVMLMLVAVFLLSSRAAHLSRAHRAYPAGVPVSAEFRAEDFVIRDAAGEAEQSYAALRLIAARPEFVSLRSVATRRTVYVVAGLFPPEALARFPAQGAPALS